MVAGSKSGACLRTISITVCAKRGSFRPITLIGKSQGKASDEPSATTGMSRCPSDRYCLAFARAHHLLLELLVELVEPPENGAAPAVADPLAIQHNDGQYFLR